LEEKAVDNENQDLKEDFKQVISEIFDKYDLYSKNDKKKIVFIAL